MSNLYDQAHGLARAIKDSADYQTLKKVQAEINADPTMKQMLSNFRQRQMELQMKQMQGEELKEEEIEQTQKMFDTLLLNPTISHLFEIEQRFSLVMEDVNKIIFEPLQEIYQEGNE